MANPLKIRSHDVTDGNAKAGARAMLRAVGMGDEDWDKAQVGVASSWNEVTPCNMPLARLAQRAKDGVRAAGGFPLEFVTIAVSDGISMGHEGMRASLVSRELIADSVETRDARRALRRSRRACRMRQEPSRDAHGRSPPQPAVGVRLRRLDPSRPPQRRRARHRERLRGRRGLCGGHDHRRRARSDRAQAPAPPKAPAPACSRRTRWPRSARRIGMSLPGSASPPAVDRRRDDDAYHAGRAVMHLLELGIRPRQIMTKEAFENAIAVTNALGGSTNAVLHLLAMANEARGRARRSTTSTAWRRASPTSPT